MDLTIHPSSLRGTVNAISSKSQAHRLLICAAFSNSKTTLLCRESNQDIDATVRCLKALGADINHTNDGYIVTPISVFPQTASLDCGESGSTLRFFLPIVCALGIETTIHMSGRLPYRPLSPLWEELERMGAKLSRPTDTTIHVSGKLMAGTYKIAGNVSSQYISGLLLALPLLNGDSTISIIGRLESKPYVDMTLKALDCFGVRITNFAISGTFPFASPGTLIVEGDWSNAAFFLAAKAMGSEVNIQGLDTNSPQGDRIIQSILEENTILPTISAADIPDLVPILSVYFAVNGGAIFTDISRLRLKESDRVKAVCDMLYALGIHTIASEHELRVSGGSFKSGVVNAYNDHRIAMSAAIAATVAEGPVTILGAECVAKSYPTFWQEYKQLGGIYEQHIR